MKKLLSLLLALALIFALASLIGCTDKVPAVTEAPAATKAPAAPPAAAPPAEPAGATEKDLKNSLPNQYVPQKLAAGMEVIVAWEQVQLDDQFNVAMVEGLKADIEPLGYTVLVSEFKNDTAVQIQHVENYLTMGTACIITGMNDPDAGSDLCKMCEEKGCYFVQQGSVPKGYVSAAVNVDQAQIGSECAKMASVWIDANYPNAGPGNEIHVAFFGNTTNTDPAVRTAATEEAIKNDKRLKFVFSNHAVLGLDVSYTAVQEAFTYDSAIKIIFTFNPTQAIGANNYIIAIPDVNLAEYAIFFCGYNKDSKALLEQSATNNGSCMRGTIAFGGKNPWSGVETAMLGLLDGTFKAGTVLWEPNWSINTFNYVYDSQKQ